MKKDYNKQPRFALASPVSLFRFRFLFHFGFFLFRPVFFVYEVRFLFTTSCVSGNPRFFESVKNRRLNYGTEIGGSIRDNRRNRRL